MFRIPSLTAFDRRLMWKKVPESVYHYIAAARIDHRTGASVQNDCTEEAVMGEEAELAEILEQVSVAVWHFAYVNENISIRRELSTAEERILRCISHSCTISLSYSASFRLPFAWRPSFA